MNLTNRFNTKIILYFLMLALCIAAFAAPVVHEPKEWFEYPDIPGLGEKARIIFFHVPTAWVTVIAFLISTVYGILFLRRRSFDDDAKAYAAARLGFIFCLLAAITGSIWAKFTWGAFWHWDPRETSIFILLLIYGAFFALRSAVEDETKRAELSSVYLTLAFLTVPFFVFIMPRIMTGLHPGSADDSNSGPVVDFNMSTNMLMVFFYGLFVFTLLFFWMWRLDYKTIIFRDRISKRLTEEV